MSSKSRREETVSSHGPSTSKRLRKDLPEDAIVLKVKGQDQDIVHIRVPKTIKFSRIFHKYCRQKNLQYGVVKFFSDGNRIHSHQTPAQLNMRDHEQIDAMMDKPEAVQSTRIDIF